MIIGITAIIAATVIPLEMIGLTGFIYMLIGPVTFILYGRRNAILKRKFSEKEQNEHIEWINN